MKVIELAHPATIASLRVVERDVPRPGAGEILIKVSASSLNFHDYLVATGVLPASEGRVPMSDGVGEVVEVGAQVSRVSTGDRVIGCFFPNWFDGPATPQKISQMRGDHVDGFAAEYVVVNAESVTPAPAGLTDVEAATLPCAALTAWRALFVEAATKPGDTVLVQGTGGVSIFVLQFARMAGANVIALSSTQEKLERLQALGATQVLNYTEQPEWGAAVLELTGGRGVDLVSEVVGGDLTQTMKAQRFGGQTSLIGALSRKPINYASMFAIVGNRSVTGMTVGSRADQEDMVRAIDANGLRPVVDRIFSFEEIADAFRYQEAKSHFGKIGLAW
jgi:NADPH:quinone reductase-like Zn-dependent oxidoreductase